MSPHNPKQPRKPRGRVDGGEWAKRPNLSLSNLRNEKRVLKPITMQRLNTFIDSLFADTSYLSDIEAKVTDAHEEGLDLWRSIDGQTLAIEKAVTFHARDHGFNLTPGQHQSIVSDVKNELHDMVMSE